MDNTSDNIDELIEQCKYEQKNRKIYRQRVRKTTNSHEYKWNYKGKYDEYARPNDRKKIKNMNVLKQYAKNRSKQARIRELLEEKEIPRRVKGMVRHDITTVKREQNKNHRLSRFWTKINQNLPRRRKIEDRMPWNKKKLRVPSGGNFAHKRGKELRLGYGYASIIHNDGNVEKITQYQDIGLHELQHNTEDIYKTELINIIHKIDNDIDSKKELINRVSHRLKELRKNKTTFSL